MIAALLAAVVLPLVSPDGHLAATTVTAQGTHRIVVQNRATGATKTVYAVRGQNPIVLLRWTGDSRWILFAVDPFGSASLAADGLTVQTVSVRGGRPNRLALMLPYPDYFAWCGGRLVFTAGGNRLATTNKRLLAAAPPSWRPRPLVEIRGRVWGSVACAPDDRSVVVQSQRRSLDYNFMHTKWALWRVRLDGSARPLTSPPAGHADESPRFARDGRLLFVRSRQGHGRVYALVGPRVVGPLRSLGYSLGYYGHRDWWSAAR